MVGDAMPAHCTAGIRAASEAEAVAGVVLVARMARAATKVGARDKTNHPRRRCSCAMMGNVLAVQFCSSGAEFSGNFIFTLHIFSFA